MYKLVLILSASFLISCSSIPKSLTCQPILINLPPDPKNYTGKLNASSTPDEVVKAWVATASGYRGWNKAVRKQIEDLK